MISDEKTLLLLRKWKEESARLRVVLKANEVYFDLECDLIGVFEKSIGLQVRPNARPLEICWMAFKFDYCEPQAALDVLHDETGRSYSAALVGLNQFKSSLFLLQIRDS
jgi:hypothetical protein